MESSHFNVSNHRCSSFSGVAYATLNEFQDGDISHITEWPACGNEEGKAPTELFYEHGEILWGYAVPQDADPIRWFKLLLLKDEDLKEDVLSSEFFLLAKQKVRSEGRRPVDMVADYLRLLWGHTMEMIEKSRGPGSLESLRFHIVITVPAIWKGYARQSMEEAAQLAGLLAPRAIGKTQLSFVLEPEAAGMATFAEPDNKKLTQPGEVWLICDAGGGTAVRVYSTWHNGLHTQSTNIKLAGPDQLQNIQHKSNHDGRGC